MVADPEEPNGRARRLTRVCPTLWIDQHSPIFDTLNGWREIPVVPHRLRR